MVVHKLLCKANTNSFIIYTKECYNQRLTNYASSLTTDEKNINLIETLINFGFKKLVMRRDNLTNKLAN